MHFLCEYLNTIFVFKCWQREVLEEDTKNFKRLALKVVLVANVTLISKKKRDIRSRDGEEREGPHQRGRKKEGWPTLGGYVIGLGGSCLFKASFLLRQDASLTHGGVCEAVSA